MSRSATKNRIHYASSPHLKPQRRERSHRTRMQERQYLSKVHVLVDEDDIHYTNDVYEIPVEKRDWDYYSNTRHHSELQYWYNWTPCIKETFV